MTGENVQELIVAANYLQFSSLENACSRFISQNIDESNLIEVSQFAEYGGLLSLQKACLVYKTNNFGSILNSSSWLELSVSDVKSILKQDDIRVYDSTEIVAPASIQEKLLLLAVLRYVQGAVSDDMKESVLKQLVEGIRHQFISKYEIEEITNELKLCKNTKLVAVCNDVLAKASKEQEQLKAYHELQECTDTELLGAAQAAAQRNFLGKSQ